VIQTTKGEFALHIGLNVWVFTVLLFVLGLCWAFGKASVFKYISDEYPDNIGVISGIVGLMGGLGGFVLPSCSAPSSISPASTAASSC